MSYTLTIQCGCTVYVACHPQTRLAHTRVIQQRGAACRMRMHAVGVRLFLWEMLPDPAHVLGRPGSTRGFPAVRVTIDGRPVFGEKRASLTSFKPPPRSHSCRA